AAGFLTGRRFAGFRAVVLRAVVFFATRRLAGLRAVVFFAAVFRAVVRLFAGGTVTTFLLEGFSTGEGRPSPVHGGLELGSRRELDGLRCRDLHRFAGTRVATSARRTLRRGPGAEPGKCDLVAARDRAFDGVEDRVEGAFRVTLVESCSVRDGIDKL